MVDRATRSMHIPAVPPPDLPPGAEAMAFPGCGLRAGRATGAGLAGPTARMT